MTTKFIGEIALENNVPKMPTSTDIPPKQEWNHFAIWEFNGRRYQPVTMKAEASLQDAIKKLEAAGFHAATKDGKRKPTSIRYAIQTTGVEPFRFI